MEIFHFSENVSPISVQLILDRLKISIENHNSVEVAIVGHHDCAGNPAPEDDQMRHIQEAVRLLRRQYDNIEVIGLWVDKNWKVHDVVQSVKPV
ncbi:MAG: hypothetical protein K9K79_01730 [Desulfohalobiaceae bacterium]|nr:hypothetical protein [Desulfohalobiaceae bacterium]